MRGKYFRYLFENLDGVLIHIGSVYDKEKQKTTNYIYMVGSYYRNVPHGGEHEIYMEESAVPDEIDILIMGGYTVKDVNKLIYMISKHQVKTIILPYLTPIQRLVLVEEINEGTIAAEESSHFLKDPYLFLEKTGIPNICFLYGNGLPIVRKPEEAGPVIQFESADRETLKLIREMEGNDIPVMRAGYIVENGWLFYFGAYGIDIHICSEFIKDYFSHIENVYKTSESISEDYVRQTKRLVQRYQKKFGNFPATTVTMFAGPLYASSDENEIYITEKDINAAASCRAWNGNPKDSGCILRCPRGKDYDVMQLYKNSGAKEERIGILMLGNANLNRYYAEIRRRFYVVSTRIRGISVPNCGNGEDWNHQVLGLSEAEDRVYWICCKQDITSVGVVGDIVLSAPNNRLLTIGNGQRCCISGYIIPKEDLE